MVHIGLSKGSWFATKYKLTNQFSLFPIQITYDDRKRKWERLMQDTHTKMNLLNENKVRSTKSISSGSRRPRGTQFGRSKIPWEFNGTRDRHFIQSLPDLPTVALRLNATRNQSARHTLVRWQASRVLTWLPVFRTRLWSSSWRCLILLLLLTLVEMGNNLVM